MKTIIRVKDIVDRMEPDVRAVIRASGLDQTAALVRRALTVQDEQVADVDEKKRTATIYLSTRHVDAAGDVVTPSGWNLKYYDMNPKGLWSHQMMELPVYKALWTKPDNMGLKQKIQFADTEFAEDVWRLFKGGFLRTFSAGFMRDRGAQAGERDFDAMLKDLAGQWPELQEAQEKVRQIITHKTLFESSIVNLPCNPYAMALDIEKGNVQVCEKTRNVLGVEAIMQEYHTGDQKRWVTINGRHVEIDDETGEPKHPLSGGERGEGGEKPSGGEKKPAGGEKKPAGGGRGDEDGGRRTSYESDEASDKAYFRREQARAAAAVTRAKAALEAHRAKDPARLGAQIETMKGELAKITARKEELAQRHAESTARIAALKEKLAALKRGKKYLSKADEEADGGDIEKEIEALLKEMAETSKEIGELADKAEAIAEKASKDSEKQLPPVTVVKAVPEIRIIQPVVKVRVVEGLTARDVETLATRVVSNVVRKLRGGI